MSMYKLEHIELIRFGSHKHTIFEIKDGVTLIFGKNNDDGMNSNGSGKSHLFEAITKLITNKTFKNIPKSNLVMDGEKTAILQGEFSGPCDVQIRREIKVSGSDVCTIWVDGIERPEIVDKDAWIRDLFGISYEDFSNYFVIGQRNTFSIFEAGDAYMKRLIARFTNTAFLDDIVSDIKSDTSEFKEQRDEMVEENTRLITTNKTLEEQNTSLREQYLNDLEEEYFEMGDSIKELKKKKKRYLSNKRKYSEKVDQIKIELDNIESEVIDRSKQNRLRKAQLEFENDITELEKQKRHLKSIINGLITCPECGHEFNLDGKMTKEEAKKKLKETEDSIGALTIEMNTKEKAWKKEKQKNDKLESSQSDKESKEEEYEDAKELLNDAVQEYKEVCAKLSKIDSRSLEIEEILSNPDEVEVPQITKNLNVIKRNKKTIKINKKRIDNCNLKLENAEFWEVAFGTKGFKTYLINKTLGMIEGYTNHFLEKFKTNLRVRIDGFKENNDGSIQERITTNILRNGEDAGVYGKFSGGERRRIDICGVLAMRRIIFANMEREQGLDILGMDELFEGLDDIGQAEIMTMLDEIKVPTFVITHLPVTMGHLIHNSLTVIKKDGISQLKS